MGGEVGLLSTGIYMFILLLFKLLTKFEILGKGALALGQFSTRAILSHTMTEFLLLYIFVIRNSRSLRIP